MMSSKNQASYRFKEFQLDIAERLFLRDKSPVSLPPKMFDVLAMLVEHGGRLVEKDELLRVVWEDAFVEESNVARTIHSLRRILGETAANKFIETVPKKGYRFVVEVEKIDGSKVSPNGFSVTPQTFLPKKNGNSFLRNGSDLKNPQKQNGKQSFEIVEDLREKAVADRAEKKAFGGRNLTSWILGTLLALTLSAAGIWFYKDSPATADNRNESKSIAVLPLKPLNNQSRDSIYELGIAESLILKLSSAKRLTVRPLSATRRYLELDQNPMDAGKEQQVDFVLSSNYQIVDGKIRVTAQLINIQTGAVEEVFKSEKDAANVFSMQDALASDIGNTLLARFGNREDNSTAKRGTSNEEAYRLYLQAAFIFDQWNKSEAGNAIGYLEKAVKLDPNYAQAYTMLSYAYRFFAGKNISSEEQYAKSKEAIEKALAIDENLAEAHAVLGLLKFSYEADAAGAENEYRRAIELDPESPMTRALYAYYLMSAGRFDEAIAENKKAMEIDPGSLAHQITNGMILYYAHRYPEAVAHYKKLLEKEKNFAYAYFWMWLLCDLQGNEAQAFEWFMKYQTQIKAAPENIRAFQNVYQKSGWKGILREIVAQDEKRLLTIDYSALLYEIACFSARLGNKEKAFEYLDKSHKSSSSSMVFIKVDPYLDTLHEDPRFAQLVKRVGLN